MFKASMGQRVAGRTPVLHRCLQELEEAAKSIREDVSVWLHASAMCQENEQYVAAVEATLEKVTDSFRVALEASHLIQQQLFIGSLSLHLAIESSFVQDLLLHDSLKVREGGFTVLLTQNCVQYSQQVLLRNSKRRLSKSNLAHRKDGAIRHTGMP